MNCSERVAGNLRRRIHQAHGRWRNNRLFNRYVGIPQGQIEITICIADVTERAGSQSRHSASVAGSKRDGEALGGRVRHPMNTIGPEAVIFSLLAIGDYRGAGSLEAGDGIAYCFLVKRFGNLVGILGPRRWPQLIPEASVCCR